MLIWIIFLVLSAVVLTILSVGIIEYSKANVRKQPTIDKGSVAGRYFNGDITIAEAVRLYKNKPLYRLSENEQKAVLYHEAFHDVANSLGFDRQAGREDYADLAAVYALKDREGPNAALEGVDLIKKMGRADNVSAIDTIEKWLEGEELTPKERKTIERGQEKMDNLYAAAQYEAGTGYGDEGPGQEMRLSRPLREEDGAGAFWGSGVVKSIGNKIKYVYDRSIGNAYKLSKQVEKNVNDAVKRDVGNADIPNGYKNITGYAEIDGIGKIGNELMTKYVFKPLGLKK